MTWSMIGGTLVSTSSDTNQRLALMVSNHTQCIGMESKVNVSVHQSKRAMNVCGNIKAVKKNESPKNLYVRNQDQFISEYHSTSMCSVLSPGSRIK
jgi:hypothetical protein